MVGGQIEKKERKRNRFMYPQRKRDLEKKHLGRKMKGGCGSARKSFETRVVKN